MSNGGGSQKSILNERMKKQLRIILGAALKFYEYDTDVLLAMDDADLRKTLLDYLERYARDERFYNYSEENRK